MPKLPSGPRDFGQVTQALGRRMKLGTYSTRPIASIGYAQNRAAQQLAGGIEGLGSGIARLGGKIETEEEKRLKASKKGGGGSGSGKGTSEDYSTPMLDRKTGKPIVDPNNPDGLTTDTAYNFSAKFKSDENVTVSSLGRTVKPSDMKRDGWVDEQLTGLRERGRKVKGAVHNSPWISEKDKERISISLRDHYWKTRERYITEKAKLVGAQEKSDALDRNVTLYSPQYADVNADWKSIWEDESRGVLSNPWIPMGDKVSVLKASAINNTVSWLSTRYSFDKQIEMLSGPPQKGEPEFMAKLGQARALALKEVKRLQADHETKNLPKTELLIASGENGRPITDEDEKKVRQLTEENPTPKMLKAYGKFSALNYAQKALYGKEPPNQLAFINDERARINSRKGDPLPEEQAYLDALEKVYKASLERIKNGETLTFAAEQRAVALPEIDYSDDEKATAGFATQAEGARIAAKRYPGGPPNFLLPGQSQWFIDRYKNGEIGPLRIISKAFGADAPAVFRELGKEDNTINPLIMANIAWMDMNGNEKGAHDILNNMKRKKGDGYKSRLPSADEDIEERNRIATEVFGGGDGNYSAFRGHTEAARGVQKMALMLMEERLASGEYETWTEDYYRAALQEAAGRRRDSDGIYYGGLVTGDYKGGGGYWDGGEFTLVVPPYLPSESAMGHAKSFHPKYFPRGAPVIKSPKEKSGYHTMSHSEYKDTRLMPGDRGRLYLVYGESNGQVMYWRDPKNYDKKYYLTWAEIKEGREKQAKVVEEALRKSKKEARDTRAAEQKRKEGFGVSPEFKSFLGSEKNRLDTVDHQRRQRAKRNKGK